MFVVIFKLCWIEMTYILGILFHLTDGAPVEVCTVLIESWEAGMGMKDSKGRNALHFAMVRLMFLLFGHIHIPPKRVN